MDVTKICRCCLSRDHPLLTLYESGGGTNEDSLAAMLNKTTGLKSDPDDKLPDKVCLLCTRDIKDFYAFQRKCEKSHRTLQQLFVCKVEVVVDATDLNQHIQIVGKYQRAPGAPVKHIQTKVDDDCSQRVNIESNVKLEVPMNYVGKSNSSRHNETIIQLEHSDQTPPPITEIQENPYTSEYPDSETDSCDSIEFISENPEKVNRPIVYEEFGEVYRTNRNSTQFHDVTAFSSPQSELQREIELSIINEDLTYDVARQTSIADSNSYPTKVDFSTVPPYHCPICEKGFKVSDDLINHVESHEKPYACFFCEHLFNDYAPLKAHLIEHYSIVCHKLSQIIDSPHPNKPKEKPLIAKNHVCDFCSKRFRRRIALTNHRRIHTGEKPYKCKYCDKTFVQLCNCVRHEKTHTGEKAYKCRFCNKAFIEGSNCKKHEISVHIRKGHLPISP